MSRRRRPTACGLLASIFCNLIAFAIAPRPTRDRMAALLLVGATAYLVLGSVATFAHLSSHASQILWGWAANVAFVCFAAAPAATLLAVARTRCSASLDVPLSVMSLANGAWGAGSRWACGLACLLWAVQGALAGRMGADVPRKRA